MLIDGSVVGGGGTVGGGTVGGAVGGCVAGPGVLDGLGVGLRDADGSGDGEGDGDGPSVMTGIGVGVASTPRLGSTIGPNVTPGGRLTGGGSVPTETPLGNGVAEPVGPPTPPGTNVW